ncbi:hypothetical protein HZH68_003253 [Vespula germanica]|uniref:Uncharacterized protein n=1 Tax=Vespula germanica TaxID=30212 RepID=A0A834U2X3_VESGE|nr:hypothetical protein HZH68_003253 [Vespula germanica]
MVRRKRQIEQTNERTVAVAVATEEKEEEEDNDDDNVDVDVDEETKKKGAVVARCKRLSTGEEAPRPPLHALRKPLGSSMVGEEDGEARAVLVPTPTPYLEIGELTTFHPIRVRTNRASGDNNRKRNVTLNEQNDDDTTTTTTTTINNNNNDDDDDDDDADANANDDDDDVVGQERRPVDSFDLLVATMADDEVLFDEVYELCEIIGK